jgi:diaminopimelate decarboxylase
MWLMTKQPSPKQSGITALLLLCSMDAPAFVDDEARLVHSVRSFRELAEESGCTVLYIAKALSPVECLALIAGSVSGSISKDQSPTSY